MNALFTKGFSALFCLILAALVLAVPILTLAGDTGYLAEENRPPASFPVLTASSLSEGEYTDGIALWLRDRLPWRGALLKTKAAAEYAALKRENNGVIYADGYLIKRFDYTDEQLATFRNNVSAIGRLTAALSTEQAPAVFVCAPRAVDVLGHLLPPSYTEARSVWEAVDVGELSRRVTETLRQKAAAGETVWFRTDHHPSSLGAYYIYQSLGETLGYTPYALSDFCPTTVSHSFLGTSYSSSHAPLVQSDSIVALRYTGDGDFICTDGTTGISVQGFYREEALHSPSEYEYFLGRNVAELSITAESLAPRPLLLIIKDSYANALAPLLARHFDLALIDLRYFRTDATEAMRQIVQSPNYAGTLVLCNADTLTADVGFTRLRLENLQ